MIKKIAKFSAILLFLVSVVFVLHLLALHFLSKHLFENKLLEAYLINYAFAILAYSVLMKLSKKKQEILGFVFMSSSLVKFALFFIFFNPSYRADGVMTKIEFLTFFIPYAICLIVETSFLITYLNKLNSKA